MIKRQRGISNILICELVVLVLIMAGSTSYYFLEKNKESAININQIQGENQSREEDQSVVKTENEPVKIKERLVSSSGFYIFIEEKNINGDIFSAIVEEKNGQQFEIKSKKLLSVSDEPSSGSFYGFSNLRFLFNEDYLTYSYNFWEGNSLYIYDLKNKKDFAGPFLLGKALISEDGKYLCIHHSDGMNPHEFYVYGFPEMNLIKDLSRVSLPVYSSCSEENGLIICKQKDETVFTYDINTDQLNIIK